MKSRQDLIKQYFWEQKKEEVGRFFNIIARVLVVAIVSILIIFSLGILHYSITNTCPNYITGEPMFSSSSITCSRQSTLFSGFFVAFYVVLFGGIIYLIFRAIKEWIDDNIEMATWRADAEIGRKKR